MRAAGFRLDLIYPADDPHTALLSGSAGEVRLTKPGAEPLPGRLARFEPGFVLTHAEALPGQGRAGMLYRDLIPSRLGGRYIASHITIPEGGPIADWVHYHRIALQIIAVRRGWVRVVYEDQGQPFVMNEGDLVLQPPLIRHRVLESSPGLEVVEISTPALHETFADHAMPLPSGRDPTRLFGRQRFLHHVGADMPWTPFQGAEVQETDLFEATDGLADAGIVRAGAASEIAFRPHDGELVFGFVLDGNARLGEEALGPADAFVLPPDQPWSLTCMSSDFRLLHVTTASLAEIDESSPRA